MICLHPRKPNKYLTNISFNYWLMFKSVIHFIAWCKFTSVSGNINNPVLYCIDLTLQHRSPKILSVFQDEYRLEKSNTFQIFHIVSFSLRNCEMHKYLEFSHYTRFYIKKKNWYEGAVVCVSEGKQKIWSALCRNCTTGWLKYSTVHNSIGQSAFSQVFQGLKWHENTTKIQQLWLKCSQISKYWYNIHWRKLTVGR